MFVRDFCMRKNIFLSQRAINNICKKYYQRSRGFWLLFFKWLCSRVQRKIPQDTNLQLTVHVM